MKTLRLGFSLLFIALFFCNNGLAQRTVQKETLVTLYAPGVSYGNGIGYVTGTYVYHFTIHLSKEGFIESIHWNARDWDLQDENGNWVRVIDSGHDTYGYIWDFWNNKDYYNIGYNITYDVPDGWLNEWMPIDMPDEGVFVDMSCKVFCKGKTLDWSFMVQLHINANGDITANFVKP